MARAARYRRTARRRACGNRLFDVFFDSIRPPAGGMVPNFLIVRPKVATRDGVAGVCVLPEVGGRIGLMRGYRHQFDRLVWQAPAGFVDAGETARAAALRELREESGYECRRGDLVPLGAYLPDAGLLEASVALYVARRCFPAAQGASAETEIGAGGLVFFARRQLAALLLRERWIGGSTLVACMRYLLRPG